MKGLTRELMGLRVARELRDGMYVNLGAGLPSYVGDFIPEEVEVVLHSENGVLGFGRIAEDGEMDPDLVNASIQPVILLPGGSFVDSSQSFAIILGGHLDMCVLGAYQVSEKGDLANWQRPGMTVGGVGGAMDLACGAKRRVIIMEHVSPTGELRLVKECTYPVTAVRAVNTVVTNLAVIEVTSDGFVLEEVAPGVTPEEVQELTEARLILSPNLKEMQL